MVDVVLIVPESPSLFVLYRGVYSESFKERLFRWQKEGEKNDVVEERMFRESAKGWLR